MSKNTKNIDLNDLYLFAQAIEAGGFSQAARKLNLSKATLSRRVAKLEQDLGVKLIQRNTHQFKATRLGEMYYLHCATLSREATLAQRLIDQQSESLQGWVHFSCPVEILEVYVNAMLVEFMQLYPEIHLDVLAVNRQVDIVQEQCDFAIRAKEFPLPDSDMIVRKLVSSALMLVASPQLVAQPLANLEEILNYPIFSHKVDDHSYTWQFQHALGGIKTITFNPKLKTRNLDLIKQACCNGLGIAVLPYIFIHQELKAGVLHAINPQDWSLEQDIVHAVYPSRTGMLPAVITLLDFLQLKFNEQFNITSY